MPVYTLVKLMGLLLPTSLLSVNTPLLVLRLRLSPLTLLLYTIAEVTGVAVVVPS